MALYNLREIPIDHFSHLQYLRSKEDPKLIKAVAREIESLFIYELIKAMRKTIPDFSTGNFGRDTYMTLFDLEIAKLIAERGIGIQEMITRKLLKDKYIQRPVETKEDESDVSIIKENNIKIEVLQQPNRERLPVNGKVSSNFGLRIHPINGDIRFHWGVDISAPLGMPVYPIRSGKVIFSGYKSGYGNIVIIDHGDGLISKYAHNLVNLVKENDEVNTNTIIAEVGNSGNSTGPHLHFEIVLHGKHIDPLELIDMT